MAPTSAMTNPMMLTLQMVTIPVKIRVTPKAQTNGEEVGAGR